MPFDTSQWTRPSGMTDASFASWWPTAQASMQSAWSDYTKKTYSDPMASLAGQFSAWDAPVWGAGNTQYDRWSGYNTGMESLLARIGAGPQQSDNQAAMDAIAQMYGYSPASWTAMIGGQADRMNASNVMANAGNIATQMADTPYGQEQAKGMRAAQQEAVAGMQKQLEAIFGERGSVGGFAAAYEMTNQLQSTFLQGAAKNGLEMFDRALSSINSENQYYQQLIQNGTIQAQDYLKFRWDSLQTSYQDYMMAMDQSLKEWSTMEQVSQAQWQAAQSNVQSQIDALNGQMATEMGLEASFLAQMNAAWEQNKELQALRTSDQQTGDGMAKIGGGIASLGLGIMAIPGGQGIGFVAVLVGGILWGIGSLLGL